MKVKISIVIPCYKSASTLEETLESVLNQNNNEWEALIINDGSPDHVEEIASKWISRDNRFKYFKKINGGLGSARNFGLKHAQGQYILPLDSDNKIRPNFTNRAMEILDGDHSLGVVYGNAKNFGDKTDDWIVGEFDRFRMLNHNYIDACAVIRKRLFDNFGYYDENLPYQGHEDWEFWLRILNSNYKFYYLKEISFDYRVTNSSMINSFDDQMMSENINYIQQKYYYLYIQAYRELLGENKRLKKRIKVTIIERFIKKLINR